MWTKSLGSQPPSGDTTSMGGQVVTSHVSFQHLLFVTFLSLTPLNACSYMTVQSGKKQT